MPRLKDQYVKDVAPALMKKYSYKSTMQIPRLEKVVINCGCGDAKENPKIMDAVLSDLSKITGQKANGIYIGTGSKATVTKNIIRRSKKTSYPF